MEPSTTRRGLLAAAGTALLAGCSGLDDANNGDDAISVYRIPDYTDEGNHSPVIVERLPVEIERAELTARAGRATALLGSLPLPLTAEQIPNGYVRMRILDAADSATDHLDEARNAGSRFAALQRLRRARSEARYVAAGWAYTQGDATESALEEEYDATVTDAKSLQSEHEYRGDDPVRAAVVHATVEHNLEYVVAGGGPHHRADGSLLAVAEWGEHAERAQATVADSRYLYEQFLDSLPDDAGSVEKTLETAVERVAADLESRRTELPPVPTDAYEQRFYRVRDRLRDGVEDAPRRIANDPGAASALLTATASLVDAMAYDRVIDRLESEDGIELEDAADVRKLRETAVEALRTALQQSRRPTLVRPVLADAAQNVAFADEDLARYHGDVQPRRLDDPVGRYITAAARARSVPKACEQVLEALGR